MPQKIQQEYNKLCNWIGLLFNPTMKTVKPGENLRVLLTKGGQPVGIVNVPSPLKTELFLGQSTEPDATNETRFNTSQEYFEAISKQLQSLLDYILDYNIQFTITNDQYRLLENIVYTILELSCQFFKIQAYDETIALLHLGKKITKKIAKIDSIKKLGQRLLESFFKNEEHVLGAVYLKQGNYEHALACFQAGLNDFEAFNTESVQNRQLTRLFYQSYLAQTYIKLGRFDDAENLLQDTLRHPINCCFETIAISCCEIGDHYQQNNHPLEAIEHYLHAIKITETAKKTELHNALFAQLPTEDLQQSISTNEYDAIQTEAEQKINACYQQSGGIQAICEKIKAIPHYQHIIQNMEILDGGILKIQLTSKDRLELISHKTFIRQLNDSPEIFIFLNYDVPPETVLSILKDAIEQSFRQDQEIRRKEKKLTKKQQHIQNSTSQIQTTAKTQHSETQISKPYVTCEIPPRRPPKRGPKRTPTSTQPPAPIEQPQQSMITWRGIGPKQTDLQHPPTGPVYPFGGFWYGYIHPKVFEETQDTMLKNAICNVLERGKISNFGPAIKLTTRETMNTFFFKIKTNDGIRIYGEKVDYDETGRHPLIVFNTIKHHT